MDKMLSIVKRAPSTSSTSAVAEKTDEEVYTEIPDHLTQTQTPRQTVTKTDVLIRTTGINNYAFKDPLPQPIYALPEEHYASLIRTSQISMAQEEPLTDDEGYLEPRQFPDYVEFEGSEEQVTDTRNTEKKTTNIEKEQDQNEQRNSSNGGGEESSDAAVVYACENKEGTSKATNSAV
ncbi:uncharacterized protein LOC116287407 [Actinia tenebrosa]|uniref:Uncharacterized protein LOC116287407 n=1 Tax=Actinia tenebrosa TaxID=6105 RepID=A0A6P8H2V8_ACTTE|nr:uncharacterized protein LOC116287407 [Actinia tenebrosa]